jgi:MobA/MobL family
MATAHFTRTTYKSGGQGRVAQRIQYITRAGPYSPAEARIRHQGLEAGTARQREDLVQWEYHNLPTWATDDPVRYFSAAERYEGANRVAYTEWRFSLPRELSRAQQLDAAHDVLQAAFGDRHPYVWALHDPPAADGGSQPHVHVLWSARTLDAHDRTPGTYFQKYNRVHPERGGAEKAPDSYQFGSVKAARVLYTG